MSTKPSKKRSSRHIQTSSSSLTSYMRKHRGVFFTFFFVLLIGIVVGLVLSLRTSTVKTHAQSGDSTTIKVEVHSFVGSGTDANQRYDGWFAVILDDGTPLVDWMKTDFYGPRAIQIPDGHVAYMYWDTQKNGAEEPYVIDPNRCAAEGDRATTTEYRDIHFNVPESPRSAGRRSVEAYCAEAKGGSTANDPTPYVTIIPSDGSSIPSDIDIDVLLEGCQDNGTCSIIQGAGGIVIVIIIILILKAIS